MSQLFGSDTCANISSRLSRTSLLRESGGRGLGRYVKDYFARVRGFGYGPLLPETPACASEFLTAAGISHWVLVRPTVMVLRVIHDCQPSPEGSGAVWEHGF